MYRSKKGIKDSKEIEEILRKSLVGRLGTSVNDKPYVVPLCFVYHRDRIYFHSAPRGKKLKNLEKNEQVCFEVDEYHLIKRAKPCDFTMCYRSVIAFGRARIVQNLNEKLFVMKVMMEKYDPEETAGPLTEETISDLVVVEMALEKITGKKNEF